MSFSVFCIVSSSICRNSRFGMYKGTCFALFSDHICSDFFCSISCFCLCILELREYKNVILSFQKILLKLMRIKNIEMPLQSIWYFVYLLGQDWISQLRYSTSPSVFRPILPVEGLFWIFGSTQFSAPIVPSLQVQSRDLLWNPNPQDTEQDSHSLHSSQLQTTGSRLQIIIDALSLLI